MIPLEGILPETRGIMNARDLEIDKRGAEPDKIRIDSSEEDHQMMSVEVEIAAMIEPREETSTIIVKGDIIDINQN